MNRRKNKELKNSAGKIEEQVRSTDSPQKKEKTNEVELLTLGSKKEKSELVQKPLKEPVQKIDDTKKEEKEKNVPEAKGKGGTYRIVNGKRIKTKE